MAKTLKRIDAGALQFYVLYERISKRDDDRVRQAKKKSSTEAQRCMNQIYSYQQLERMLAKNFPVPGSALVLTLPFDDAHLPHSRKEAQLRARYFRYKLRLGCKAEGLPDPVIFWAPEILTSASGRWHLHMVIDNTGRDMDLIRRCWIYGENIEIRKLRVDSEKNHETLARYMTKELRECQEYDSKPGLHGWSCTRNAKRPEVDTVTVPDDYSLDVPEEWSVLLNELRSSEFSSYHVLKCRVPKGAFVPPKRARRRRAKPRR